MLTVCKCSKEKMGYSIKDVIYDQITLALKTLEGLGVLSSWEFSFKKTCRGKLMYHTLKTE